MSASSVHSAPSPRDRRLLRIGLCITELEPGGAERCLTEIALRLDRTQFEPFVYCLDAQPTVDKMQLVERLVNAGVPIHYFGGATPLRAPLLLRQLAQQLQSDKIDLLQCFLLRANFLGPLAAKLAGIQHILGGIRVAERRGGGRWVLSKIASRYVDRWVCVSKSVADFAAQTMGLSENKLAVIGNGIDATRYAAERPGQTLSGLQSSRRYLLFVGRLDPQKGLEGLIAHLGPVLEAFEMYDVLVVGRGPLQPQLERQVDLAGLKERIRFLGYRDDVPQLMAASDLFVFPSRWEGMPNALLEAMAAGLPIASTAAEGVVELLGEASERQTVAVDDYAGLANRIVELLRDQPLRDELGKLNRRRALAEFSIEGAVRSYERLFRQIARG